jgi:hypothetical protein
VRERARPPRHRPGTFTGPVAVALTLAVFGVSRATTGAAGRTDQRVNGRPAART